MTCDICGLPDLHRGQGDGIGSCDCPRCECGTARSSMFCTCEPDDDYDEDEDLTDDGPPWPEGTIVWEHDPALGEPYTGPTRATIKPGENG